MPQRGDPVKRKATQAAWRARNAAAYRLANREKFLEYQAKYRASNKEKCLVANRKHRELNRESINEKQKVLRATEERQVYMASKCREYQAKKRKAVPAWAASDFEQLVSVEAYALAKLRKKLTGIDWHVDHVVPLQSNSVCGLHCSSNLQVIPGSVNIAKSNRSWPDMPA